MNAPTVAVVSTVRTSLETIELWVNYYLNCGIGRLFLFFDDPDDPSIRHLSGDERITIVPCNVAHWSVLRGRGLYQPSIEQRQTYNATLALRSAKSEGIDWLIHVDSDELIFTPESNIAQNLSRSHGFDVVIFGTLEAIPRKKYHRHPFLEVKWFKKEQSRFRSAVKAARLLGCRQIFESGYIKGHTIGKSAVRTNSPIEAMDIHYPKPLRGAPLKVKRSTDGFLLHFDCATLDDWILKWQRRLDGTAIAMAMRDDRKRQFAEFSQAFQSGSNDALEAAYRRQYAISGAQLGSLALLGLARRIRLQRSLFKDATARPAAQR